MHAGRVSANVDRKIYHTSVPRRLGESQRCSEVMKVALLKCPTQAEFVGNEHF